MKIRSRNFLNIILSIAAIVVLAIADIKNNGKITIGLIGFALLLIGSTIISIIIEVRKERKIKK